MDTQTAGTASSDDTIAAIATPPGVGGIGIVRISGPDAFAVGRRVFRSADHAARGESPPSHLLTYGHVVDPATGDVIDEALAAFMRAPRTYTREDVVELSAHGGPFLLRRVLAAVLAAGARAAGAGEMTLRAFLNGRLDLAQAEAVMSLINAETDASRRLALRQLQGDLSTRVREARATAMAALVRIEASIDFPEEEVPAPDPAELSTLIEAGLDEVRRLLASSSRGRIVREGLRVAIVGRPNVGKSSLLNTLLGTDRAIVTPIAGTTRDTVEERATIGGIALHLVDTAGLTPSEDPIERVGVERSRAAAREADLLLFVLDASVPLTDLDRRAAHELAALRTGDTGQPATSSSPSSPARITFPAPDPAPLVASAQSVDSISSPVILVLNKSDLPAALSDTDAAPLWPGAPIVHTSTRTRDGAARLEETIATLTLGGQIQPADVLVSTARHQDALRRAAESLSAAHDTLTAALPLDFVSIDLRAALEALGEITGETATSDLLDRIFAEFCIGK